MKGFVGYLERLPKTYSFHDWLTSTRQLQEVAFGDYYDDMGDEERADNMMMNLYAACDEIHEMGDEMGWKPWAPPRGWINREAAIREAVDALHFIGNLLTHAQCTGEELTAAYRAKQLKNLQRQIDSYDGKAEKCGYCKRDLSELPTRAGTYQLASGSTIILFCDESHYDNYKELNH
jgi:hypothetical protein